MEVLNNKGENMKEKIKNHWKILTIIILFCSISIFGILTSGVEVYKASGTIDAVLFQGGYTTLYFSEPIMYRLTVFGYANNLFTNESDTYDTKGLVYAFSGVDNMNVTLEYEKLALFGIFHHYLLKIDGVDHSFWSINLEKDIETLGVFTPDPEPDTSNFIIKKLNFS